MSFFAGQLFEEEGCYDFDIFVDELFDTAGALIMELDKIDKKCEQAKLIEINKKLLRLLHVFILPALMLRESELADLQKILSWIEHMHHNVEVTIGKRDKTKYNVENSLREQRARLLITENFSSQHFVATCDPEFLQLFLKHLHKDISTSNEKLMTYEKDIVPLRGSLGDADVEKLSKWRKERDEVLAYLDRALEARETINNVIGRPHIAKKITLSKRPTSQRFHVMYVEIAGKIQEMNMEIQELIKRKIQISCVREATLLAIAEIVEDGESYGYERKAGKFEFETDIYDPKNKPEEWTTLTEKISDLLKAKPLGFRDSYDKFCKLIKLKCQCLFDDSKMFSSSHQTDAATGNALHASVPVSPSTAELLEILGQSSVNRRSTRSANSSMIQSCRDEARSDLKCRSFSTRFSFGSIPKEQTEAICKEIIAHISEMAETLAQEVYKKPLNEIYRSVINKIYICYESHISIELMPLLHQLYEQSYKQQCEGLSRWISHISLSDIGFDDKKFEALVSPPIVAHSEVDSELQHKEETEVKVPIGENRERISLEEISKMSVDELYKVSNMELAGRQTLLSCAPGMDGWAEIMEGEENIGPCETDLLNTQGHDSVFENETDINEQGVSPSNYMMTFAENFITAASNTASQKEVTILSQRKTVNQDQNHNRVKLRKTPRISFPEPPSYEDVVMRRQDSPPPDYQSASPARAAFFEAFEMFESILKEENEAVSLFRKLRVMTKAIQYIEKGIANLREEGKSNALVCADDILDIVILLLSRLDSDTLLKVYAHLNLMIHLSPKFMHGNAHDYALVTFNVAYQHMFEQRVLHNSPKR